MGSEAAHPKAARKEPLARAAIPIFCLGAAIYFAMWYFAPDPKVLEAERGLPWWDAVDASRRIQLMRVLMFFPVALVSSFASYLALRQSRHWVMTILSLIMLIVSAFFALAASFTLLMGGRAPTGMLG